MTGTTTDGPEFLPNMDNGGRWHHIASERELAKILTDPEPEIYEVPSLCITFLVSRRYMSIVRAEAFGGDRNTIEGGWVYSNHIRFMADRAEILELWNAMGGFGMNAGGRTEERTP